MRLARIDLLRFSICFPPIKLGQLPAPPMPKSDNAQLSQMGIVSNYFSSNMGTGSLISGGEVHAGMSIDTLRLLWQVRHAATGHRSAVSKGPESMETP